MSPDTASLLPSPIHYSKTKKRDNVLLQTLPAPVQQQGSMIYYRKGKRFHSTEQPPHITLTQVCVCVCVCVCVWMCPMRRCLLCLTSALSRVRSTLNLNECRYYVELSRTDPKHLAEALRPRAPPSHLSVCICLSPVLFTWSPLQSMRLPLKLPFPVIGPAGMSLRSADTHKNEHNTQRSTFATDLNAVSFTCIIKR